MAFLSRLASGFVVAAAVSLFGGAVQAQEATSVQIVIKDHRFSPAEVKVPAGKPITIRVDNQDATPEEFESKTLRIEKIIPGKSSGTFNVRALQPGRYKFFGEFNEATAQGVLVVE